MSGDKATVFKIVAGGSRVVRLEGLFSTSMTKAAPPILTTVFVRAMIGFRMCLLNVSLTGTKRKEIDPAISAAKAPIPNKRPQAAEEGGNIQHQLGNGNFSVFVEHLRE